MKNWCFTILLVFLTFSGACSVQTPSNDVQVSLEFQPATDSSFHPTPILQIENKGSEVVYFYLLQWHYEVKVDSLTGSALLDYAVEDALYLGYTQYEFAEPAFVMISPDSKVRIHSRPIYDPVLRRDVIPALPEKGVYARVGYLRSEEVFAGRLSHSVRSQILKFQETVSSAKVYKEVKSSTVQDE